MGRRHILGGVGRLFFWQSVFDFKYWVELIGAESVSVVIHNDGGSECFGGHTSHAGGECFHAHFHAAAAGCGSVVCCGRHSCCGE